MLRSQCVTVIKEPAIDLSKYPTSITEHSHDAQVVIGDMHGNALKLLHYLIRNGILQISPADQQHEIYAKFVALYASTADLNDPLPTADIIARFRELIQHVSPTGKTTHILFIGDMLADRGENDWYTLMLLMLINPQHATILFSNHDEKLIRAFEKNLFNDLVADNDQSRSALALKMALNKELINFNTDCAPLFQHYRKMLKALSYTLSTDGQGITIHTHGKFGLEGIAGLANKLNIAYRHKTPLELAETIDSINDEFQKHVAAGTVHSLYGPKMVQEHLDQFAYPFESLAYSRNDTCRRPALHDGYSITYVHGHDMVIREADRLSHIHNIDNRHGFIWTKDCYTGEMHVLHETGKTRVLPINPGDEVKRPYVEQAIEGLQRAPALRMTLQEFKIAYTNQYESEFFLFKNPFSKMKNKIKLNKISSMEQVEQYARTHPKSRTAIVINKR